MTDFSYQLYCSRNFPPLADTLKMVAAAGYKNVEGYGALYADEAKVAELNDAPRRQRPQDAHRPLRHRPARERARPRARDRQGRRHRDDLLPLPHRPTSAPTPARAGAPSASGCRRRRSPTATPASASAGTTTTSSSSRPPTASLPQTAIFEGGPDLEWEADIAWVIRGGADPLEWIRTMASASPRSTSRTSPPPARTPTRTAGPTSATAPSTGRRSWPRSRTHQGQVLRDGARQPQGRQALRRALARRRQKALRRSD